jgi:hypothetical protein
MPLVAFGSNHILLSSSRASVVTSVAMQSWYELIADYVHAVVVNVLWKAVLLTWENYWIVRYK